MKTCCIMIANLMLVFGCARTSQSNQENRKTQKEKPKIEKSLSKGLTFTLHIWREIPEIKLKPPLTKAVSIAELLKSELPPLQHFVVDNSKDTAMICTGGTVIELQAHSFDVPDTVHVNFSVREFQSKTSFLAGNLNTMSGENLLESGGMLHLSAETNGKEVQLKKDKALKIGFPYEYKKEGMLTFYGEKDGDDINWTNNEDPFKWVDNVLDTPIIEKFSLPVTFTTAEIMPEFLGGTPNLFAFLGEYVTYPALCREMEISGKVYAEFIIRKDGSVDSINILRTPHPALGEEVKRVITKMPKWSPGYSSMSSGPVDIRYTLPVNFSLDNDNSISTSTITSTYDPNAPRVKPEYYYSEEYYEYLEVKKMNNSYILESNQLGWINCDRFYNDNREKIYVKMEHSNADVKLVFNNINSIMKPNSNNNVAVFSRIPKGASVTIIATQIQDKQLYLAKQSLVTRENITLDLNFKPVTQKELKDQLTHL